MRNGLSLNVVLFIVFVVLKLCSVIQWSWIWVTAPLWIPIALFFFIGMLLVSMFVVMFILASLLG